MLRVEFDYEYFDDLPTGASIARIRFHFDPASVDEVDGDTLSGSLEAGGNRLEATPFRVRNDIDCDGAFEVPGDAVSEAVSEPPGISEETWSRRADSSR